MWTDIQPVQSQAKERTGYPTQKPLALYERIIQASSNEGDFVLDPFCGCATTPVAAEQLNRQWVGMDIWDGARDIVLQRLAEEGMVTADSDHGLMFPHDVHVETTPPERSDDNEVAAPSFKLRIRRPREPWQRISHKSMTNVLAVAQASGDGVMCAGCGRVMEREFMQLDHITPRSDRGENHILNRILLCGPCNRRKRDYLTLRGLMRENKKKAVAWMKDEDRAKLAQDSARDRAEWLRDNFDTPECQALIAGRSGPA
ncbi:MAG: HNH endonuclease [Anaerolineae bacterium]|nr:HNH endonuclease [Anaerolineae bacterium]